MFGCICREGTQPNHAYNAWRKAFAESRARQGTSPIHEAAQIHLRGRLRICRSSPSSTVRVRFQACPPVPSIAPRRVRFPLGRNPDFRNFQRASPLVDRLRAKESTLIRR